MVAMACGAFAAALATIREARALDLRFKTDVLFPSLGWAFLLTFVPAVLAQA
jgi:hypothetical protein